MTIVIELKLEEFKLRIKVNVGLFKSAKGADLFKKEKL